MEQNRREFLMKSGCGLGMAALATQVRHFGLMSALAQKPTLSKKAERLSRSGMRLHVGGNDGNNTVIPNHNSAQLSIIRRIIMCDTRRGWQSCKTRFADQRAAKGNLSTALIRISEQPRTVLTMVFTISGGRARWRL